jgi:hypothetical protein
MLVWLLPPLILLLAWRLRYRARRVSGGDHPGDGSTASTHGADSELYAVCDFLVQRGFEMRPGDTLKTYLTRCVANETPSGALEPLLRLHNHHRFAATSLSRKERDTLRANCERLQLHLAERFK